MYARRERGPRSRALGAARRMCFVFLDGPRLVRRRAGGGLWRMVYRPADLAEDRTPEAVRPRAGSRRSSCAASRPAVPLLTVARSLRRPRRPEPKGLHVHQPVSCAVRAMLVLGTRPEAIKLAPVARAMAVGEQFEPIVVTTGQHREMLHQIARPAPRRRADRARRDAQPPAAVRADRAAGRRTR
ncbi:hypothetical protein ACRAWF_42085 [Streptomyces sp. L7]